MFKDLVEKVENIYKHMRLLVMMWKLSKESKGNAKNKTISEINDFFDRLISRLYTTEDKKK